MMRGQQRNYSKQELIYDLLFGDNLGNRGLRGISSNILENTDKCLICNKEKSTHCLRNENKAHRNETNYSSMLLCIDCKRRLFSFEGFKYQCNQIKKMITNLDKTSIVLSDQVTKLNNTINRVGYGSRRKMGSVLNNKNNYENTPPGWCDRDIPPKYGKGRDINQVQEAILKIKDEMNNDQEDKLLNQLGHFHNDLINLQETIITFINVLETYVDTPFISIIRDGSNSNDFSFKDEYDDVRKPINHYEQPCIKAPLPKDEIGTHQNNSSIFDGANTTAHRIEKIRRQQEKVREQIKSLYDNALNKSPVNKDTSTNHNSIGSYFQLDKDEISPTRNKMTVNIDHDDNSEDANYYRPSYITSSSKSPQINSYNVLWSPSSISSSSPLSPPSMSRSKNKDHPALNSQPIDEMSE